MKKKVVSCLLAAAMVVSSGAAVPGFFFTRLHQDRSYCLGLSGTAPLDGMYYSVDKTVYR